MSDDKVIWLRYYIIDNIFEKQLGKMCEIEISDLFMLRIAKIITGISLNKY